MDNCESDIFYLLRKNRNAGITRITAAYYMPISKVLEKLLRATTLVKEDIEDAVQEALARLIGKLDTDYFDAYERMHGTPTNKSLRNWITTVAHNLLMDELRSHALRCRIHQEKMVIELASDRCPGNELEPEHELEYRCQAKLDLILQLLQTLPEGQKEVLEADREYPNIPDAELAEILGRTPNSIASSRSKGLKALRKLVGTKKARQ